MPLVNHLSQVSVVVCAGNQSQLLRQTVENMSLYAYPSIKVIVIMEGPLDSQADMQQADLSHVLCVRQSQPGIVTALTRAVRTAQSAYLLFLEAGDAIASGRLERQVKQMEAHPRLGLAYFGGQLADESATYLVEDTVPRTICSPAAIEFLFTGNPLVRRDCVERMGWLDAMADLNADWDPWQAILQAGYETDAGELWILCKEHLRLYLQNLDSGEAGSAERHMRQAVRLFPGLLQNPQLFKQAILAYLPKREVSDSVAFAQLAIKSLPECAQGLGRIKPRLLAEIHVAQAFNHYGAGQMSRARQNALASLRYDTLILENRGAVSIFVKSFLGPSAGRRILNRTKRSTLIPPAVLDSIRDVLGQELDSVELAEGGTYRSTYLVRIAHQRAILRLAMSESDVPALRTSGPLLEQLESAKVPVPAIIAAPPVMDIQCAWLLEEWKPGHHFVPRVMSWRNALTTAAELGCALHRLHAIQAAGYGALSADSREAEYSTFDAWLEAYVGNCTPALPLSHPDTVAQVKAAVELLHTTRPPLPGICHGDLALGNVLTHAGHLSALIDWGGLLGADPAFDLAVLSFWVDNEQIMAAILAAYAPAEPEPFRRRVMAMSTCYAAVLLTTDFAQRPLDLRYLHHRCSKWLAVHPPETWRA